MYCHKCGKEIPSNAEYCTYCGSKVFNMSVEEKAEDSTSIKHQQKKKSAFSAKTIIVIAILVVAGALMAVQLGKAPNGAFEKRFAIANIDVSIEASDNDQIMVPMFSGYWVSASEYEENGGFGGLESESDYLEGVSAAIQIKCHKDNTFEMNFYDNDLYGEYIYDRKASTITFYVDDNEYVGQYDGRDSLEMWSDDGSRFDFKDVRS